MKKHIALLLVLCMAVSVAACSENGGSRGTYEKDKKTSAKEEDKEDKQDKEDKEDNKPVDEPDQDVPEYPDDIPEEVITESGDLVFETVDIYGKKVDQSIIAGSKLVLLNLWEPWCGPCVNEMPDLEALYEKYMDDGLIILGAYTTFEMDADAEDLVRSIGITYPVIKADENIYSYEQSYVPATFIFDGYGNLLDEYPVEGSRSYDEWEALITAYLYE